MIPALNIDPTESTPAVYFDKEMCILEIEGFSFPENSFDFFKGIIDWLSTFCENPSGDLTVRFRIKYCNSSSTKEFLTILSILDKLSKSGQNSKVEWHYVKDDRIMRELGEELEELFNCIKFQHISYERVK